MPVGWSAEHRQTAPDHHAEACGAGDERRRDATWPYSQRMLLSDACCSTLECFTFVLSWAFGQNLGEISGVLQVLGGLFLGIVFCCASLLSPDALLSHATVTSLRSALRKMACELKN